MKVTLVIKIFGASPLFLHVQTQQKTTTEREDLFNKLNNNYYIYFIIIFSIFFIYRVADKSVKNYTVS